MTVLTHGYKGMRVLLMLNWHRMMYAFALFVSLKVGSYLALIGVV